MENKEIKLKFNSVTGDYEINHKGFSWVSDGRRPYIIIRKKVGKKYISTYRLLMSALKKTVEKAENRIVCRYENYIAFGKKLPFALICTAEITGDNTVTFSVKAENETGYDIQAVYFPAPFNSKEKGKNPIISTPCARVFYFPTATGKTLHPLSALLTTCAKSTPATAICPSGAGSVTVIPLRQSLKRRTMPVCSLRLVGIRLLSIPFTGCPLSVSSLTNGKSGLFSMKTATTTPLPRITASILWKRVSLCQ